MRRNFDRHAVSSHAFFVYGNVHIRILIQDFSRMGVGFVSEAKLPLKTFVSLLYQNEPRKIIQIKSYVKHVRSLKSGLYFVGVQFIGIESKSGRRY